jgi:hypothetical protein
MPYPLNEKLIKTLTSLPFLTSTLTLTLTLALSLIPSLPPTLIHLYLVIQVSLETNLPLLSLPDDATIKKTQIMMLSIVDSYNGKSCPKPYVLMRKIMNSLLPFPLLKFSPFLRSFLLISQTFVNFLELPTTVILLSLLSRLGSIEWFSSSHYCCAITFSIAPFQDTLDYYISPLDFSSLLWGFSYCYSTKFHTYAFVPWPNHFPILARLFPQSTSPESFKKYSLRAYPQVFLVKHVDIREIPQCNPWMP